MPGADLALPGSDPFIQASDPHMVKPQTFRFPVGVVALVAIALLGCSSEAQIETYEVLSADALNDKYFVPEEPGSDRILGAMLPKGQNVWFFKISGDGERVGALRQSFEEFLKTVEFLPQNGGAPSWKLPEGWTQTGETETRFATITIPHDGAEQEIAVSFLERRGDLPTYLRLNLNRWRGQLGRPAASTRYAARVFQPIETPAGRATLVDLTGELTAAARMPSAGRPIPKSAPPPETQLSFTTPLGWRQVRATSARLAAFEVETDDQSAEASVMDLEGGGGLVENINRWRGQIGLGPASAADIEALGSVTVEGAACPLVEIFNDKAPERPMGLLAAIIRRGNVQRFVKMIGDVDLVRRERANFVSFVESIRSGDAAAQHPGNNPSKERPNGK